MRNLKLFNHWIAEVRDIARGVDLYFDDGNEQYPMSEKNLRDIFGKDNFYDRFESGLTPREAFAEEMDAWMDSQ